MANNGSQAFSLPPGALPIGLGCSRLGSINGATGDEARQLISLALDAGVRFFDTSNIYAQGDSERLLGEVLGQRDDCIICSKAGKYLDWKKQALVPLKGMIRTVVRRSSQARQGVASARSKPMPTRWDAAFLQKSIDGSLKRLNRSQIEMFMLHSPGAEIIANGEALDALESAQKAGKIGVVGVSVDDVETAITCLKDLRVRALQIPLLPGDTSFDAVVRQASERGVAVIAREILGGSKAIACAADPAKYANDRIAEIIKQPEISLPLVGTTKVNNLNAAIEAANAAKAI